MKIHVSISMNLFRYFHTNNLYKRVVLRHNFDQRNVGFQVEFLASYPFENYVLNL